MLLPMLAFMKYDEFIAELQAAGVSGRELARLLRLHENSISSYSTRGKVPSHLAVIATLIHLLAKNHIGFREPLLALEFASKPKRRRSGPRGEEAIGAATPDEEALSAPGRLPSDLGR